jgi:hypothetical protein
VKERDAEPTAASDDTFERILDRALDYPEIMAAMPHADPAETRARLRAQALEALCVLARTATAEYDRYLGLRAAARRLAHGEPSDGASTIAVRTGDGSASASALLMLSLTVAAAGVYVLCGFDLRALDVRPHMNDGLVMVAVIVAAVTAGAALGDLVWSLATRERRTSADREHGGPEVREAYDDWQLALLERGLVPFLLSRLDEGTSGRPSVKGRRVSPP